MQNLYVEINFCSSAFTSSEFGSFGDIAPSSPLSSTNRLVDLTPLPPELVVIVKNIQKRDTTTRSKAVQDLQTKISDDLSQETLENLLTVWVLIPSRSEVDVDHSLSAIGDGF